mgnify:FL=1
MSIKFVAHDTFESWLFDINFKEILIIYTLLRNKTAESKVFTSISSICTECGYSTENRGKDSFNAYIRMILKDFIDKKELVQIYGKNLDTATNTALIVFKIEDKFYDLAIRKIMQITPNEFDIIVNINSPSVSAATLFKLYVYMRHHIATDNLPTIGFIGSIERVAKDLDLNRKTVDACLDLFVDHNLFVKYTTGSCYIDGEPRNVPNIYVLPDDQAENNIKALLEELKQRYRVEEFAPVLISSANNK